MAGILASMLVMLTAPQTDAVPRKMIGLTSYPAEARRRGEEGTVIMNLTINTKGKATVCNVMRSSGSKSLDYSSCRIAVFNMRYASATNAAGQPAVGTASLTVNWRIGCKSPVTETFPDAIQVCVDPA